MRKINLPLILDTVFAALCSFLLFFTAIRYYTRNVYVALAFAVVACFLFGCLSFLYISKKQNKKLLISRDEKQKKLLSLHLSLSTEEYILNLLSKALSEENPEIKNGRLITEDNAYFYNFKMQPVSEDDVAKVIKVNCENKKIIFCNCISVQAMMLCQNFLIEVKDINFIYALLKDKELLPEKYVYEGQKKISLKNRIKARFTRKLCAPLFWSGLALLFLSYFSFFSIYYIISGGIMLTLAAVALVFN